MCKQQGHPTGVCKNVSKDSMPTRMKDKTPKFQYFIKNHKDTTTIVSQEAPS